MGEALNYRSIIPKWKPFTEKLITPNLKSNTHVLTIFKVLSILHCPLKSPSIIIINTNLILIIIYRNNVYLIPSITNRRPILSHHIYSKDYKINYYKNAKYMFNSLWYKFYSFLRIVQLHESTSIHRSTKILITLPGCKSRHTKSISIICNLPIHIALGMNYNSIKITSTYLTSRHLLPKNIKPKVHTEYGNDFIETPKLYRQHNHLYQPIKQTLNGIYHHYASYKIKTLQSTHRRNQAPSYHHPHIPTKSHLHSQPRHDEYYIIPTCRLEIKMYVTNERQHRPLQQLLSYPLPHGPQKLQIPQPYLALYYPTWLVRLAQKGLHNAKIPQSPSTGIIAGGNQYLLSYKLPEYLLFRLNILHRCWRAMVVFLSGEQRYYHPVTIPSTDPQGRQHCLTKEALSYRASNNTPYHHRNIISRQPHPFQLLNNLHHHLQKPRIAIGEHTLDGPMPEAHQDHNKHNDLRLSTAARGGGIVLSISGLSTFLPQQDQASHHDQTIYKIRAFQIEKVMIKYPLQINNHPESIYTTNNELPTTVNHKSHFRGVTKEPMTIKNSLAYVCVLQRSYYKNYWLLKTAPDGWSYDQRFLSSTGIKYQTLAVQILSRSSHQFHHCHQVSSFQRLHPPILAGKHTGNRIHPEHGNTTTTKW
jgi:hypothetical protein